MHSTPGVVDIVDDDAAVRQSIERMVQTCGYATASFCSAESFLRRELADSVMGLVLEIHLEGMSGMDLCRHFNSLETTVPIVLITTYEDTALRAEAAPWVDVREPLTATLVQTFPDRTISMTLIDRGP